jgi:hypothetical protein
LPQGAASSSRIAYWLIERWLPPLNPSREFNYGDDLFILGQSEQEVNAQVHRFRKLFRTHAAGPLQLGCHETGELTNGGDFLGVNISRRRDGKRPTTDTTPRADVLVADDRYERFVAKLREKAACDVENHDPHMPRVYDYVRAFLRSAPPDDHRSLVRRACEIVRCVGGDPDVITGTVFTA